MAPKRSAFSKTSARRSPAVLLDLVMPVMGGEEALRAMRQIDRGVCRVILSSGYSAKAVAPAAGRNARMAFSRSRITMPNCSTALQSGTLIPLLPAATRRSGVSCLDSPEQPPRLRRSMDLSDESAISHFAR